MQQVAELKGHTSAVMSVAFDSSGKYLASGEVAWLWLMNTMNPYVIENLWMIRDDDNDNYSDIEDHGDADGDGDCFRRIDCPGDGYDEF